MLFTQIYLSKNFLDRLLLVMVVLVAVFLFTSPCLAQTLDQAVYLDQTAMAQKGYTISSKNQDLQVGIRPGIFNEAAWVKIKNVSPNEVTLPVGKNLVSPIYVYDIRVSNPKVLDRVIFVTLKYNSQTNYKKRIYFWNQIGQEWIEVPSKTDLVNNLSKIGLPFPWSQVAVFEDPEATDEPQKITDSMAPVLQSEAAIVMDARTGKVMFKKNPDKIWWLASLTKLMTAIVFLETDPDFDRVITYRAEDNEIGGKLYCNDGETLRVKDAFMIMLIGSANNITNTLVRSTGLTSTQFVDRMNAKAQELGLTNTIFTDPTGLALGNKSTGREYAKVVLEAAKYYEVYQAANTEEYSFTMRNTGNPHQIRNTNKILNNYDFILSKTGYLDESLYNFATKIKDASGNEIVTITLGSPSGTIRFKETSTLIDWTFANWQWQ